MMKQTSSYGCALYAIANVLNEPKFITDWRLECSKTGIVLGVLNNYLHDDYKNFHLHPLCYSFFNKKLPTKALKIKPEEGKLLPFLISCQLKKESSHHIISGVIYNNGEILVYDSTKSEPIKFLSLGQINKHFYIVSGLFLFTSIHGDFLGYNEDDEMKEQNLIEIEVIV